MCIRDSCRSSAPPCACDSTPPAPPGAAEPSPPSAPNSPPPRPATPAPTSPSPTASKATTSHRSTHYVRSSGRGGSSLMAPRSRTRRAVVVLLGAVLTFGLAVAPQQPAHAAETNIFDSDPYLPAGLENLAQGKHATSSSSYEMPNDCLLYTSPSPRD